MATQAQPVFDDDKKQAILDALRARGFTACVACNGQVLEVLNGYTVTRTYREFINQNDSAMVGMLPTVTVVCSHCGHLSQHSFMALGLPPT